MDVVLERFCENLPDKPAFAEANKILNKIANKNTALKQGQLVKLATNKKYYLPIDVDYEGAGAAWIDAGAPQPTIVSINPDNYHAHLLYELQTPVPMPLKNSYADWIRAKPIEYYRAVKIAGTVILEGDAGYNGVTVKNPLHPSWYTITNNRQYTLDELARGFCLDNRVIYNHRTAQDYVGRNDELFHEGRFWAYRKVKKYKEFILFSNAVFAYCTEHNKSFEPPLGLGEVNSTAKSIARWTWGQRHRPWIKEYQKNRGAMSPFGHEPIDTTLDEDTRTKIIRERQTQAAEFVNHNQKLNTEQKIKAAIKRLQGQGQKVTKTAIARESSLSRPTIYEYQYLLDEAAKNLDLRQLHV